MFTVTDGGFAKRTAVEEYRCRAAAASAIKAMKLAERAARWSARSWSTEGDEVLAITASGR